MQSGSDLPVAVRTKPVVQDIHAAYIRNIRLDQASCFPFHTQVEIIRNYTHNLVITFIYEKPLRKFFFLHIPELCRAVSTPFLKDRDLPVTNLQTNILSFLSSQIMVQRTEFSPS